MHTARSPQQHVLLLGTALHERPAQHDSDKTLQELIDEDPDKWMFDHSDFPDEGRLVAEGVKNGTVLAISDGSYMPNLSRTHAMAAWILECQVTKVQCRGVLQVPGMERDVNAHRAEMLGGLAIRKAISLLERRWGILQGSVTCGLDCNNVM